MCKICPFQVYTYSGLLLLILLAEFGAGIAALVCSHLLSYNLVRTIYYLKTWYTIHVPFIILQYKYSLGQKYLDLAKYNVKIQHHKMCQTNNHNDYLGQELTREKEHLQLH